MTQVSKFRKVVAVSCVLLLAAMVPAAADVSPASSLGLPLETPTVPVKTPTVTVKTPVVTVTTPTVTVKTPVVTATTPTVTVKTPTVSVKTPTVPVKVPTVPVKAPTVTVKVPSVPVKTTTAAKTPSVPVKVPTVPVKTPTVSVKTPAVTVHTGSAGGPSVSVKSSAGGSAGVGASTGSPTAARRGSTGSAVTSTGAGASARGAAGSGSGGSGGSVGPLGSYGSPGAGYGELPPIEGSMGRRERARIERRERHLKAIVARFRGCLSAIPATERAVLELRTGYGPARALSPRATAARLHVTSAQLAHLEGEAVRELGAAASTHSCGQTGQFVAGAMSFIAATFGGPASTGANGGVEAVRYSASPTGGGASTASGDKGILGAGISPLASDVLLALGTLFVLGLVVIAVIADAAGQGPRHAQWRQRVINRFNALR
jgi:hypothetical protein